MFSLGWTKPEFYGKNSTLALCVSTRVADRDPFWPRSRYTGPPHPVDWTRPVDWDSM